MSKTSRAFVALVAALSLLLGSSLPSALTARADAATSIYGETYLTLSSFSGFAGNVAVSGGGYQPGTEVAVSVGGGGVVARASVNAQNAFGPVDVSIPVGTPQGAISITATGNGGVTDGLSAVNSYYVTPFVASISVTAAAHTPGTPVLVDGSGFAPNETVDLALASAASTVVADATGAFSGAVITVPDVAPSSVQLTATGTASGAIAVDYFYIDAFYPSAYPSAYYLLPGSVLSFSGQGFKPGETVSVREALGAQLTTFVVPTNASFETVGGFVIPLNWANTSREIQLVGAQSNGTAAITVSIGAFFPSVSPSLYYAMPGQDVTFNGNGFAPNETVNAYAGTATTPFATGSSDADGAFEEALEYSVPYGSGTGLDLRFVGAASNAQATLSISIGALFPQIQPSEYYIQPGKALTVTGSGFADGETVSLAATGVAAEAVADQDGVVTLGPVTVPFSATESLELTATGATSGGVASVTITIGQYNASVTASSYYLLPGNPVVFTGSGFAPGETVELLQGLTVLGSAVADEDGAVVTEPVVVPFGAAGAVSYALRGQSSLAVAPIDITVGSFFATVSADNYYVQPGSVFNVTGGGFAPNEAVTVALGENLVRTIADEDGVTPLVPLTMAFLAAGESSVAVVMTGEDSGATAETNITAASFYPNVTPSSWYDRSGDLVSFSGNGFAVGESVAVTLNENAVTTALVGADGTFELTPIALPYGVDVANFAFTGSLSNATATVSIGLAPYSPSISPSTWYGKPGEAVTFSGTGFAPGETVTARQGTTVIASEVADADGAVEIAGGTLPFVGPAGYSFIGSLTNVASSIEIGVSGFYPGVQLSSYYGPGGSSVVVTGSGFAPGESVAVVFGSTSLGSVVADGDGAFSTGIAAPFAPAGSVDITATGAASGASASTTFTYAQVYNSVELGSYGVGPGEAVNFIGSGFLSGEPVQVLTDRTAGVQHSFVAGPTGSFDNSGYVLPASFAPGELTLTIRGANSFTEHSITIYVTGG